jgi:hypothetical protein
MSDLQKGSFDRLERYELKYHIPFEMVAAIEDFILPYCTMDAYCKKSADGYYTINSLYMDTPRNTFMSWKESGLPDRFNMRIRAYGEEPSSPFFYEIKRKRGDLVTKYRGRSNSQNADDIFKNQGIITEKLKPTDHENLERYYRLAQNWNASPKVLTRYRRKAFFSEDLEYARLTFDTAMENRKQDHFDFHSGLGEFRPSDLGDYFTTGNNTVLELKCYTSQVPFWMLDLIKHFQLERRSYSKFCSAMYEVMQRDRFFQPDRQAVY